MPQQDNAVAVTQRLIAHHKLPVSKQTIEETIMSHPDYPSLKSICDGLNEWKIRHYPVRLGKEELRETKAPFIAHLKGGSGMLVFVPELNGKAKVNFFDSNGKSKTANEDEFFKNYSGVSLLIEPDENAGEKGYKQKKQNEVLHLALPWLVGVALVFFAMYTILGNEHEGQLTLKYFALLFTKIIGLFLSVLLVLKDLKINSKLADSLCGDSKKTNCNSILNSAAAKVFAWLHWSDIGLIYFLIGLLMMIGIPTSSEYSLMAMVSFGVLVYVGYSILHQAFVAKSWCPLCLGIQAVFIAEAALCYTYLFPFEITMISIIKYAFVGLICLFGVGINKIYLLNRDAAQQERLEYLKFKRNPQIFMNLLQKGKRKDFNITENVFVVGNSDAPIEITAFLNLNCHHCKEAFNQLMTLLENEHIKANLIFTLHKKYKAFINQVTQLFQEQKQNEAIELLDSWYNGLSHDQAVLIRQAEEKKSNNRFELIQKEHKELFNATKVKGTPTFFVNGFALPKVYQIEDINGFTNVLTK